MVRVAVLGAGRWGPNLLRCLQAASGCEVTWLVDARPERLEAVARGAPGLRLGTSAEAALADPGVDAVAIATPTSTHAELTRRALHAGKHVLVEKPLAASVEDARALEALAAQTGLVLLVGHVYLFNPAVVRLGELLASGAAGALRSLRLERTNLGPIRTDADVVLDLASHDVSLVHTWLKGPPASVRATGGAWVGPPLADEVQALLRYPGGPLVQLHASWLWPRKVRRITAVGSLGMLTFDDLDAAAPLRLQRFVGGPASGAVEVTVPPGLSGGEPLQAEVDHFLCCVRSGLAPRADARHGAEVARTLEALQRSLAQGGREVLVSARQESG
jgi:predicted dehydrogenase